MGAVNFTINKELVLEFKKLLKLNLFVETGTYKGGTLDLVKDSFDSLYSCELDEKHFQSLAEKFKSTDKIKIYNSTSPLFLSNIKKFYTDTSTLFWLDAHFMSQSKTDVDLSQCPILGEINSIGKLNDESVVLVDDARYFTSPPPYPNDFKNWPDFTIVVKALFSLSETHDLVVFNDVLVLYPRKIKNELFKFMSKNTFDVLKIISRANEYDNLITQVNQKETEIHKKETEIHQKEHEIKNLLAVCDERLVEINNKQAEINNLLKACDERMTVIRNRETEIKTLFAACDERMKKIDSITLKVQNLEDLVIAKDLEIKKLKQQLENTFH